MLDEITRYYGFNRVIPICQVIENFVFSIVQHNGFRILSDHEISNVESARILLRIANLYYNCSAIVVVELYSDENCSYEPTYYTKLVLILFSLFAMIDDLVRKDQIIGFSLKNYALSTDSEKISLKSIIPQLALPERKWFDLLKKIEEYLKLFTTNVEENREQDSEPVIIYLPRLNLKFKLEGQKIISENFKDYRLSLNQNINTLFGVPQYLLIEPDIQCNDSIKFNRKIIIPYHPIKKEKAFFSSMIQFDSDKVGKPAYFSYEIDENLKCLNSETTAGSLYLALLYFKTATLDKDLLLEMNGYETCAEILKTCWQNCQYSDTEFNIILKFFENTCPDLEKPWSNYAGKEEEIFKNATHGSNVHHRNTHAIFLRLIYLLLSSYQADFLIKADDRIDKRCRLSLEEEKKLLSSCVGNHSNSRVSDYYKAISNKKELELIMNESKDYKCLEKSFFSRKSIKECSFEKQVRDVLKQQFPHNHRVHIPNLFKLVPNFLLLQTNEINCDQKYHLDSNSMKLYENDIPNISDLEDNANKKIKSSIWLVLKNDYLNEEQQSKFSVNDLIDPEFKLKFQNNFATILQQKKVSNISNNLSNVLFDKLIAKSRNKELYEFFINISNQCQTIVNSRRIGYTVCNTTGLCQIKMSLAVRDIENQINKKYSYSETNKDYLMYLEWNAKSIDIKQHYENLLKLFHFKSHYPKNIDFPLDPKTLPEDSLVRKAFSKGYGKIFVSDLEDSYGQPGRI
ncbi:unnamed protein product, partial [Rotaria sp. Silwood2]